MSIDVQVKMLATWFGCGRAPRAPGTVGTLGAIPLVWVFAQFGNYGYMLATMTFVVVSIWIAQAYEDTWATEHDAPEFVMDEVAGFLVAMTWVPLTWQFWLLGFVVFRVLDAAKPFPISWVDRKVPGGVGAVADDLVAGILTNVLLQYALHSEYTTHFFR